MFQLSANARLSCLLAGAMLFLGACAETPIAPDVFRHAHPAAAANPAEPARTQPPRRPHPALNFADWRERFRAKALQAGIQPQVFDQAFAGVTRT